MAELWYLKKFSCLMQGHEELTSANFRFYNFIVTTMMHGLLHSPSDGILS